MPRRRSKARGPARDYRRERELAKNYDWRRVTFTLSKASYERVRSISKSKGKPMGYYLRKAVDLLLEELGG